MKILHLSYYDNFGGASKASLRIFKSQKLVGINSKMLVFSKNLRDKNIFSFKNKIQIKLNNILVRLIYFFFFKNSKMPLSMNLFNSGMVNFINKSKYDIINFHWINHEMLSLKEISKIQKPIIWTIHDQWPFASIEHYISENDNRYRVGYNNKNSTFIERKIWRIKKEIFEKKINFIISPSRWIAKSSKQSLIFKNKKHFIIPYPILRENYKFQKKYVAIKKTSLKNLKEKFIITYGASSSISDDRKGFKYVLKVIEKYKNLNDDIFFIIFGECSEKLKKYNNVINYGHIKSNKILANIYSSSDIFLAPSLNDNLPLSIMESISCGTPVVAFSSGGIKDLIWHKKNGYLAKKGSLEDLVKGINYFKKLDLKKKYNYLEKMKYKKFMKIYSPQVIAKKYESVYKELIK